MMYASPFPPVSWPEHDRFMDVLQSALHVRRHFELLSWLQGDLQFFLPHDILLAAWGDLGEGPVYIDVVSPLPGVRTEPAIEADIAPFVRGLFGRWRENVGKPIVVSFPGGVAITKTKDNSAVVDVFRFMSSMVAHGIKDERGNHDCLYAVFNSKPVIPDAMRRYTEILLPYIDTALRQVNHLPKQLRTSLRDAEEALIPERGLSTRELEIMKWVRSGKTNEEVGMILGISAYTVKNHLQRIFRKLDVTNRAQAVDRCFLSTPSY